MVTLSLFRHAKSAWDNTSLSDFRRPLAPRGEQAAPRMGRFMADNALAPDVILCSTAQRARQTLELALPAFAGKAEVQFADSLYHAGPAEMLKLVRALGDDCRHAMLVGHNPGMQAMAMELAGDGDASAIETMSVKFPTAGLAVIDFDCGWADVAPGRGRLRVFKTPRQLQSS